MGAPKSAKRASSYADEGDGFVASDDDTSSHRPTKKSRKSTDGEPLKDSDGSLYWELSRQRRVAITDFKGKTLVNIREYYEKDGKQLPGKKGISMTMDQYNTLVELLPEIEKVLKKRGEKVPRPQYTGSKGDAVAADEEDDEEEEDEQPTKRGKKSNIETTSDEDEG